MYGISFNAVKTLLFNVLASKNIALALTGLRILVLIAR